jgi:hypothetical protein
MSRKRSADMLRRGVRSAGASGRRGPVMTPLSPSADARLLDVNYRPEPRVELREMSEADWLTCLDADAVIVGPTWEGVRRMTEQEWLASTDVERMLSWLVVSDWADTSHEWDRRASDRKLRLFACAVERGWWAGGMDNRTLASLQVAEAWADGALNGGDREVRRFAGEGPWMHSDVAFGAASMLARHNSRSDLPRWAALLRDIVGNPFRPVTLCGMERNPFHNQHAHVDKQGGFWLEAECPACARLRTPTVVALANAAYDHRAARACQNCDGYGRGIEGKHGRNFECPDCNGTGKVEDGTLENDTLAVLADALSDAGCCDETILTHLRSDGPHVRGCWVLDLLLGKE